MGMRSSSSDLRRNLYVVRELVPGSDSFEVEVEGCRW